ncbi:MAG: OOP family OmpA-OmpF porin, partial [Paracoccaceae bacterium]
FAKATFGGENVYDTTRTDPTLPDGWPLRILAGLDALGRLHHGILIVSPEMLEIRGTSSRPEVSTEVTQSLSEKLGEAVVFEINITYEAALNKVLLLPTPGECVDNINTILTTGKIVFAPSSTKLDVKGFIVVTKIAEAMVDCSEVPMEIGGHTDSQGRENMNQTLSQARAEAVLDGLLSNDVLTTYLSAKGYGESQPIADNATEEGRATNRRIEFKLLTSDASNQLKEASDQENTNGQD